VCTLTIIHKSCSKFDKDSKSGDSLRGGGVSDPETKSVGNFLKRKDIQTKLVYEDGKGLKNTKN